MNPVINIPSTELARHFSDYLSQVRYGGKTIIIEKNKKPVAELRPLQKDNFTLNQLIELIQNNPVDADFADDLEKVNSSDTTMENPWD